MKTDEFENEQPVFKIFPSLTEYSTKDLFTPHPSKSELWAYKERADDIIVFKNSFLCNPICMKQQISLHPSVETALMFGTGRVQSGLLIEPKSGHAITASSKHDFIEKIWPMIEKANLDYPKDARVAKSYILLTDTHKAVRRASKGVVQRGPTLRLYQDALDELYAKEGDEIQQAGFD